MLTILRKYQRSIFIVVAFAVILSFTFFGTYSAMMSNPTPKEQIRKDDQEVALTDCSTTVRELVHFIRTDILDLPILEDLVKINVLNDGILKKDFFRTGLGLMLLQHYYDELQVDLRDKVQQFRKLRPYTHPEATFISSENVWRQFASPLYEHYLQCKEEGLDHGAESLEQWVSLYLDQCDFPPATTRQILYYLQQQYGSVVPFDRDMQSADLAVFRAKTAEDWFGIGYIRTVAQFIHKSAIYAQEQGYRVSTNEAHASLRQIFMDNLCTLFPNQHLSAKDLKSHYDRQLYALGLSEKQAVELWRQVLLFRRLFEDFGQSVLIDKVGYEQLHRFIQAGVQMDVYAMPEPLRLHSEEDLQELHAYISAVAPSQLDIDLLCVPDVYYTPEEVLENYPELVQQRFLIDVVEVTKQDLYQDIGLQEVISWAIEERCWKILHEHFPLICVADARTKEERFDLLEALSQEQREALDIVVKQQILQEAGDRIQRAFARKDKERRVVPFAYGGDFSPLRGIQHVDKLRALLEENDEQARKFLSCYTEDGEIFYRFTLVDKSSSLEIVTYAEAKERGVLGSLLATVGSKENLLEGIRRSLKSRKVSCVGKRGGELAEFCAKYRFYGHLLAELEDRQGNRSAYIIEENKEERDVECLVRAPIRRQFAPVKSQETVLRKMGFPFLSCDLFSMAEGDWSPILEEKEKGLQFLQVKEHLFDEQAMKKGIQDGRLILSNEAKRYLMSILLNKNTEI